MTITETTWQAKAACRGLPLDLFVPDPPDHTATQAEREAFAQLLAQAYSVCEGCPVKGECLAYGESSREAGVWGGKYLGHRVNVGGLHGFIRMRDGVSEPKRITDWDKLKRAQSVKGVDGPPTLAEYVKSEATNGTTTQEHQSWVRRRNPEPELSPDWNDHPMRNGTALHAEMVYVECGIAALEDRWVTVAELVERTGLTTGVIQHVLYLLTRTRRITERDPGLRRAYQAVL